MLSVRPYRRQAGSHRYATALRPDGVPVGAGLPAIGPVQSAQYPQITDNPTTHDAQEPAWTTST